MRFVSHCLEIAPVGLDFTLMKFSNVLTGEECSSKCFEAFIYKYLFSKSSFLPINAGVVFFISSRGSLLIYLRLPVTKARKCKYPNGNYLVSPLLDLITQFLGKNVIFTCNYQKQNVEHMFIRNDVQIAKMLF